MSKAPILPVALYEAAWITGTYAECFLGDLSVCICWPTVTSWSESQLLETLKDAARSIGANSVVNVSITIDPFSELDGASCVKAHAVGTAAILHRL